MAQSAAIESLIQSMSDKLLFSDYFTVSALAIPIYDYLLTFHLEVQFIWLSPWNYTKILYIIIRYLQLGCLYMNIYLALKPDASPGPCQSAFVGSSWTFSVGYLCAEVALMLRTWAIWYRNRILGFVFIATWLAMFILSSYFNVEWMKVLKVLPPLYPGFRGCLLVNEPISSVQIQYIVWFVVDVGLLALMVFSGYRSFSEWISGRELTVVIHRDGILYYVYLLAVTVINLAMLYTLTGYRSVMMNAIHTSLYSVLTCRVILNIRSAAQRDKQFTSLHEFTPVGRTSIDLEFIHPHNEVISGDYY